MFGVTIVALLTALGTSPAPQENFVPGEIMVRFISGSEADKMVTSVGQESPLRLGELAPVAEQMEGKTGVPLTVAQLTSGRWVVLKVDVERVNRRLVERLRGHRNVARAELTEGEKGFIGYSPPKKVAVKFEPGSAEAKTVSEKLKNQGDSNFTTLVSQLEATTESPLICEATQKEELLAQVDLRAVTLTLQERLNALPSVEATQLNYVMKAF